MDDQRNSQRKFIYLFVNNYKANLVTIRRVLRVIKYSTRALGVKSSETGCTKLTF